MSGAGAFIADERGASTPYEEGASTPYEEGASTEDDFTTRYGIEACP